MAQLAEEIVEEWLNREGYFTIRGIRIGVHEIDLLALRTNGGRLEGRHIEVQASSRPISYLLPLSPADQKATGRKAMSVQARQPEEHERACAAWIEKKFDHRDKVAIKRALWGGAWTRELVIHRVRHHHELERLSKAGVRILRLSDIVTSLRDTGRVIPAAAGGDLLELVGLSESSPAPRDAS
jgi:hypothetical protein